jgi:hypothetical protein
VATRGTPSWWRSVRRSSAAGLTTLLAAVLVVLVPAAALADHGRARPTDNVCPPPDGDRPFLDVDDDNFHRENIECIGGYGISIGYPDGTYRPALSVTRAQMASFIADFVRTSGRSLPSGAPPDEFGDISGINERHRQNINALARAGIVRGRTADSYGPNLVVSRAQMASFISDAIDYAHNARTDDSEPPITANQYFDDIQHIHTRHRFNINRLAEQHIVTGVDAREYAPHSDVSRGAMASFIMRAASYLEEIGAWEPFPPYGGATSSWMIGGGLGVLPPEVAEPRDAAGHGAGDGSSSEGTPGTDAQRDDAGTGDGDAGSDDGGPGVDESGEGPEDAAAFAGDFSAAPWYRSNAFVALAFAGLVLATLGGLRRGRTPRQSGPR